MPYSISLNFLPLASTFISSLFNFHYSSPFNLCLWQLLEINSVDLIAKGNSDISSRQSAANKLLDKVFRVRLGRGFYGECLVNIICVCVRVCVCTYGYRYKLLSHDQCTFSILSFHWHLLLSVIHIQVNGMYFMSFNNWSNIKPYYKAFSFLIIFGFH